MIRNAVLVMLPLGLAACGGAGKARPEPILMPVEVVLPTTNGCVPANMAPAPDYPDTDDALRQAPDAAARYKLVFAGRKLKNARLNEVEPVIASCPKATAK